MPMLRRMLLGLNTKMGGGAAAADPIADIEALLPAGSYFWLGDDATGPVASWTDRLQSFDVSQATEANKPTTAADSDVNNKNVLIFDGTQQFLQSGSFTENAYPNEVFLVAKTTDPTAARRAVEGVSGSAAHILYTTSSKWALFAGAGLSGGTADTSWHVWRAIVNNTSSDLQIDGASVAAGGAETWGVTGFTIGRHATSSVQFWEGRIAAVIFSDGLLAGDGATIVTKLQTYYGL